MSTRPETKKSLEMLFAAKWNLPKAAANANLTNKEMKIIFNEYCCLNVPTYGTDSEVAHDFPLLGDFVYSIRVLNHD